MNKSKNPLYYTWTNIKTRCYNKNNKAYKFYGERGIIMCDRWLNSFQNFCDDMGHKPTPKHSIDRINNDDNYEPGNCRWTTMKEQSNNMRTNHKFEYNGLKLTCTQWEEKLGFARNTILQRINRYGWSIDKAINTPTNSFNSSHKLIEYNGLNLTHREWSRKLGFSKNTISERIKKGWTIEQAITTPLRQLSFRI